MKDSIQFKCFSQRVFGLLFLTALSAVVAIAPVRLIAQDGAPAQASKSEAKPSQEEQNNAFRLEGPIVKWAATTFNTTPETAATTFEFLNFAIIVFGIGIPLFKFLPKFLRTRAEKVRNDIESARKVTEDANMRLSAVEARLAGLYTEIAEFRAQVEAESVKDEARIKSTIKEESARIVAAAEQELTSATAQARRSLRHFAADLAIEQATKQLVLTPEADKALIAEFIGDVNKGGVN